MQHKFLKKMLASPHISNHRTRSARQGRHVELCQLSQEHSRTRKEIGKPCFMKTAFKSRANVSAGPRSIETSKRIPVSSPETDTVNSTITNVSAKTHSVNGLRVVDGGDWPQIWETDSQLPPADTNLVGVSGSLLVSRRFLASAWKPSSQIIQYDARGESR